MAPIENTLNRVQNGDNNKVVAAHVSKQFSGPLPPPEYLEHYNQIVPTAAERIIAMAEKEQSQRHEMQKHALRADVVEGRIGQVLGFLIGIFTIGCGTFAAINGAQVAGTILGAGGVVALVTAFILGRQPSNDPKDKTVKGR